MLKETYLMQLYHRQSDRNWNIWTGRNSSISVLLFLSVQNAESTEAVMHCGWILLWALRLLSRAEWVSNWIHRHKKAQHYFVAAVCTFGFRHWCVFGKGARVLSSLVFLSGDAGCTINVPHGICCGKLPLAKFKFCWVENRKRISGNFRIFLH